jgi:hypothetical protein
LRSPSGVSGSNSLNFLLSCIKKGERGNYFCFVFKFIYYRGRLYLIHEIIFLPLSLSLRLIKNKQNFHWMLKIFFFLITALNALSMRIKAYFLEYLKKPIV